MKLTAIVAVIAVVTAMPVQAQTSDSAATSSAAPVPQSDALNAIEDDLWVDIQAGDAAFDKLAKAYDGKADAATTCRDIDTAYTAYNSAYAKFQGVLDAVAADTVLPADAKPGETEAVNELWNEIATYLNDLDDLAYTYGCSAA